MARHVCLKQWINGYELSISIDDNLCDEFRSEIALFDEFDIDNKNFSHNLKKELFSRSPIVMADNIIEMKGFAESLPKGNVKEFKNRILKDFEGLRDNE